MALTNRHPLTMNMTTLLTAGVLVIAALAAVSECGAQDRPRGPYLGQRPPGATPLVFAPGLVSTEAHEFSCSFTPDGKEFYFARRDPARKLPVIMVTRSVDGTWTEPAVAAFVEDGMSFEPMVTPDGRRLYYTSARPVPGAPGISMNIVYVEREGDGWSQPKDAGPPFNPMKAMYVSMTAGGTVYTTDVSGGMGTEGIAVVRAGGDTMDRLGPPVNVDAGDMYPCIAPDESSLIFASRRPPAADRHRLFISRRQPDGSWSEPIALDLGMDAGTPRLSPDGKYLFFTGGERGKSDIYWVDATLVGGLRPADG